MSTQSTITGMDMLSESKTAVAFAVDTSPHTKKSRLIVQRKTKEYLVLRYFFNSRLSQTVFLSASRCSQTAQCYLFI